MNSASQSPLFFGVLRDPSPVAAMLVVVGVGAIGYSFTREKGRGHVVLAACASHHQANTMAIDEGVDRAPASIHRILLVEDDRETATDLKRGLEGRGFSVEIAKDGGQAQAAFVMHKPDLVVVDLVLPGESGYEVCERFKQTNDSIPVVVLTVVDMADSRALAERVGADDYLVKPRPIDELAERLLAVGERVWQKAHGITKDAGRVRFSCGSCGKKFKVSASHRGKSLTCPRCSEPVIVPRHD